MSVARNTTFPRGAERDNPFLSRNGEIGPSARPTSGCDSQTSMESTQASYDLDTSLGALVYTRKHTGAGHAAAAAFIFGLPTLFVSYVVLFEKQNPGVEPMGLSGKLAIIAITGLVAGGAGLFLFIKGRRGRKAIEAYERGVRLRWPSRDEVVFKYADVRQLKRRTLNAALAGVEFTLNDGASYEIGVHAAADVRMLNYILERYGPIAWQQDNTFRIM